MKAVTSWPPEADALCERSVERYGGRARWSAIRRIVLTPRSLSGLLAALKGYGRTFPLPARIEIVPGEAHASFVDYPAVGARGIFDRGRVALDDAPLVEHRRSFAGPAKWRRWNPLDALYFFGYALTHYHALPFTLREAQFVALTRTRRGGATHALTVRFAPEVHTHCAKQTFYFDDSGLILRHDYVAEVIGSWARGAHLWRDYRAVEGFPIATHRRVMARIGAVQTPLVALDARFGDPVVVLGRG